VAVDKGLWMDSAKFQSPLYISPELLQSYEQGLIERENTKTMLKEIEEETSIKELQRIQAVAPRTR
jgi:hypothetical protein